jgi:hypothetical protein
VFRPASSDDFNRYAGNLQWLLEIKLSEAKELLAQIYGFSGLHDLQKNMETPGSPGPYWDDSQADWAATAADPLWEVPGIGERTSHARDVWLRWRSENSDRPTARQNLIIDLGLTDSPPSHRECFRRVREFVAGIDSFDNTGFPTGYWSAYHGYFSEIPVVHDSFASPSWAVNDLPIAPLDQRTLVGECIECRLFVALVDDGYIDDPATKRLLKECRPSKQVVDGARAARVRSMASAMTYVETTWNDLLITLCEAGSTVWVDLSGAEQQRLAAFLAYPNRATLRASSAAQSIADPIDRSRVENPAAPPTAGCADWDGSDSRKRLRYTA